MSVSGIPQANGSSDQSGDFSTAFSSAAASHSAQQATADLSGGTGVQHVAAGTGGVAHAAPPSQPGSSSPQQAVPTQPAASQSALPNTLPQANQGVAPQNPAQPAGPSQAVLLARQAGLQVPDTASDFEVMQAMATRYQQVAPYAQFGYQALTQQPQPTAQQPAAPADEWTPERYFQEQWGAPQWDPQYDLAIERGLVVRDENTGLWTARQGYELMVSQLLPGLNQASSHTAERWQEITQGNPYEHFYQKLMEPMKRQWQADIQAEVDRRLAAQQRQQELSSYEARNASWLYASDAQGSRVPTPLGQQFVATVKYLRDNGMTDPATIFSMAERLVGVVNGQPVQAAPVAAPSPGQVPQAPPPNQPPPQPAFLQNAVQRAAHSPPAGANAVQSPNGQPENIPAAELRSMFSNAYRAHQGAA